MLYDNKCYECKLVGQEDLGAAYVYTATRDKAKSACACSAFDAGYLRKPSPHLVRCIRAPHLDGLKPGANSSHYYSIDAIPTTPPEAA